MKLCIEKIGLINIMVDMSLIKGIIMVDMSLIKGIMVDGIVSVQFG